MHAIYSEMLELSQDPNLHLYIAGCAGISITLFATAILMNIREHLRSRKATLMPQESALNNQYASNYQGLEEAASAT